MNRLEQKFRKPAITALTFLVTSSGTRNIVSEDDLLANVVRDDHLTELEAREVLKALSRTTRLVFRQTRGDSAFYEISSEFLIPWITEKRQARERDAKLEKQREDEWRLKNQRSVGLAARSNATAVDWCQNRKAKGNLLLKGVPLCQPLNCFKSTLIFSRRKRESSLQHPKQGVAVGGCFGQRLQLSCSHGASGTYSCRGT